TRTRFKQAFRVANYQSQARPSVTVSGMPDVEYVSAVIGNDTAIVQIIKDIDQLVTVSIEPGAGLTIRDATVVEGASCGTTATFEVELAGE
ncbi:MAG: hypothetical protein JXP37_07670, partial [Coriobacteriia bacterium]|nr:hypothetical protein [Coriobacteriia bacterium]